VLGFKLRNEAVLETLTTDVVKSTEIEGQKKQIYNYPNFSYLNFSGSAPKIKFINIIIFNFDISKNLFA